MLLARMLEALGRKLGRAVPLTRYRLASAQADLRFDCARAQADLGWTPRVGVRPGLRRLIEAERSAIDGDGPGIARREEEAESPPRIPSTA